jgi:hypothetical protein
MSFEVNVIYLLHEYTYCISTEDEKHFICSRQTAAQDERASAPPETIILTLEDIPKPEIWGKSLTDLYRELAEKITAHITKEPLK